MKEAFNFISTTLLAFVKSLLNGKRWRQLLTLAVTLWNEDLFDDPIFREVIYKLIDKNRSIISKETL